MVSTSSTPKSAMDLSEEQQSALQKLCDHFEPTKLVNWIEQRLSLANAHTHTHTHTHNVNSCSVRVPIFMARFLQGSDRERDFVSQSCLLRYLRARSWNVEKATKMLEETLKWRKEYKPDFITANDV